MVESLRYVRVAAVAFPLASPQLQAGFSGARPSAVPTSILGLLMLVAVAEFLIGLVGNGVFVVWSFREWLRTFRESLYNLIVLSLAVCWLLLQWLIVVDSSLFLLFQSSHWLRYLSVFRVLVSQASLWFASFLSVCYCRKILSEHAVLWLKQRACYLSCCCLLVYFTINLLTVRGSLDFSSPSQGNSSILFPLSNWHYICVLQLNTGSMMPCMTFLVSSGLLTVPLYGHYRKMKVHTAGRRDAQAKAHITVQKSLACFLILYMVCILASPFSISSKTFPVDLITLFISETYPSLHSVILIMGNPRMKQTCERVLWKTVCA
ncbi:LOW QUALITY PROTEIN: taste receptor type 2 member 5 [Dama dama]